MRGWGRSTTKGPLELGPLAAAAVLSALVGAFAPPVHAQEPESQEPEAEEEARTRTECIRIPDVERLSEDVHELLERARELGMEARRHIPGPGRLEMPRGLRPPEGRMRDLRMGRPGVLGVSVTDLNPELGAYFGAEGGVLVLEVAEDAPLALRGGDVVVGVDGRSVEDARHLREIVRSYRPGEEIRIEVLREGSRTTVSGTLE